MAIPGIKNTQSAIDSYKALNANVELPAKTIDAAKKLATESVAYVRKPIQKAVSHVTETEDALSYALSHGTPKENVGKLVDIEV